MSDDEIGEAAKMLEDTVRESPSKSPAAAPLPTYNSLINIGEESSIWGTLSPEREE